MRAAVFWGLWGLVLALIGLAIFGWTGWSWPVSMLAAFAALSIATALAVRLQRRVQGPRDGTDRQ